MQRHPVAQTVTHVDFIIVRRDEVISADVPIILVGEALEVHHGDGLVDQQMFTLSINALPAAIPSAIEADVSELTIGGQVRGLRPVAADGVTTDVDPETAVAIGQPPRCHRRGRGGRGRGRREGPRAPRAPRRPGTRRPRRAAKRARPCAAPSPGPSTGAPRPTCSSSGWATRAPSSPAACTTPGPTPSSCWPAPRRVPAGREGRAGAGRRGHHGRPAGGAGRPDHVHERLGLGRALAGHALRDRRPGRHRGRARRARPAAGDGAAEGGRRAGRAQRAALDQSHLHSADFLRVRIGVGKPPSAARARRTCCAGRRKAVRELLARRWRRRPTPSSASRRTGIDAAMLWCHSLPT